ncbi:MAG: hypothetical protein RJA81_1501 [Planctomycetota bacterium]|jgi:hypothetical protein
MSGAGIESQRKRNANLLKLIPLGFRGFGLTKGKSGMNQDSRGFLAYNWTDRLQHYLNHENSEQTDAMVAEVIEYLTKFRLIGIPKQAEQLDRSGLKNLVNQQIAAVMLLYDRRLIDRVVMENGEIRFRPLESAESLLLSSTELIPVVEPLLKLIELMRKREATT